MASQVMAPIVPGMNSTRYEYRSGRPVICRARNVATAIPDRLSLHSAGWQMWQDSSTSSGIAPGSKHSPYVR